MSATGTLVVELSSPSRFLTANLPIEVRDSRHALVQIVKHRGDLTLPVGLYTVTAVLEDGSTDSRTVSVRSNTTTRVEFEPPIGEWFTEQDIAATGIVAMNLVDTSAPLTGSLTGSLIEGTPGSIHEVADGVHLLGAPLGLEIDRLSNGHLAVELQRAERAWICLSIRDVIVWQALPLDFGSSEARRCVLRIEGARLELDLPRERRVTNALRGMVDSGKVGDAIALADDASALLASKYSDPIGAALGALILERFGQLGRHAAWVENLARDFAWLADGGIALAAVLSKHHERRHRDRGLAALFELDEQHLPIFSDAFSLALALLRSWPDSERRGECDRKLASLATTLARFDFDTTFSTMRWNRR